MLETLQVARDSIPDPSVSALQAQLAAVKQAELVQQQAFEQQRQIAAAMQIEKAQPQEPPQLSERDLQFLGSRPGVQNDPTFNQSVQALAHVYQYGSDDFYQALDLRYPRSHYRREEPRHEPEPPAIVERNVEEPKPTRRIVTSAPVSRSGAPSGDYVAGPDSVKLTAEERHFAAQSGVSEAEYGRNKLRLAALKKSGMYNE